MLTVGTVVEMLEPVRKFDGVPGSQMSISPRSNEDEYYCESSEPASRGWICRQILEEWVRDGWARVVATP